MCVVNKSSMFTFYIYSVIAIIEISKVEKENYIFFVPTDNTSLMYKNNIFLTLKAKSSTKAPLAFPTLRKSFVSICSMQQNEITA